MFLDDRASVKIPPSVMRRNPRLRGLWVRRAVQKLLLSIRDKYLDTGQDIFNITIEGDTLEVNLRGNLEVSELTEVQMKNRRRVIRVRKRKNITE